MAEDGTRPGPAALGARRSPVAGVTWPGGAVTLADAQPGAIVRLQGPDAPALAALPDGAAALWTGPREWLIVAESASPPELRAALRRRIGDGLPGDTMATDTSHGWRRLRARGAGVAGWLQAGVALDLDSWPLGRAAPTAYREIPVVLHAAASDGFDIYVPRSYARCLWEWLADAVAGVDRAGD